MIPEVFPFGELEEHPGLSSLVSAVVDWFCCGRNEIQYSDPEGNHTPPQMCRVKSRIVRR